MHKCLRAQTSLIFNDEVLYNGLIEPYKQSKELNSLIIRLLSSYFYSQEVRDLVDNTDKSVETEDNPLFTQVLQDARNTFAMMEVLTNSLTDLTDDALDEASERLDSLARRTGGEASKETEFGYSNPRISVVKTGLGGDSKIEEYVRGMEQRIIAMEKERKAEKEALDSLTKSFDELREEIISGGVGIDSVVNSTMQVAASELSTAIATAGRNYSNSGSNMSMTSVDTDTFKPEPEHSTIKEEPVVQVQSEPAQAPVYTQPSPVPVQPQPVQNPIYTQPVQTPVYTAPSQAVPLYTAPAAPAPVVSQPTVYSGVAHVESGNSITEQMAVYPPTTLYSGDSSNSMDEQNDGHAVLASLLSSDLFG